LLSRAMQYVASTLRIASSGVDEGMVKYLQLDFERGRGKVK
jgi:hypothetical protein